MGTGPAESAGWRAKRGSGLSGEIAENNYWERSHYTVSEWTCQEFSTMKEKGGHGRPCVLSENVVETALPDIIQWSK